MRFLTSALLAPAALLVATAPAALLAQEVVQALPGTTDADRLAEQMRALAANPRDLNALIAAADLSLSLGDLSGAASLYARAEKVSVSDPRIKAGEGAILVRSERPGEALRYFAQAEAAGYDMRAIAADRGLAYDLIGQQERAQRDYRLALKTRPDDEVVKRYALSLGISGKRDAALEQLDPLLRKQDRSAWRIRAFILAMGGDQVGAEKIAATMLPAGMAQGLQPFFQRLPSLPAADRAFAVHFGEVRASPERLADARLVPNLPLLAPEATPVALAAVQPANLPSKRDRKRRGGRDRDVAPAVALAANTAPRLPAVMQGQSVAVRPVLPASVPTAVAPPASSRLAPVTYQNATAALARVQPVPQPAATRVPPVTVASATPNVLASRVAPSTSVPATSTPASTGTPRVADTPAVAASTPKTAESANLAALTRTAPTTLPARTAVSLPTSTPAATSVPVGTAPIVSVQPNAAAAATVAPGFTSSPTQPGALATTTAPAATMPAAVASTVTPLPAETPAASAVRTAPAASASYSAPPSRAEADSVLARIVAGLSIPAAELGVAEPVRPVPPVAAPAPDTAARVIAEAKAKEERDAIAERALAAKTATDKAAAARTAAAQTAAAKTAADKAAATKATVDKRTADRKAATDKKALAAKKLADEKKLADAKAAEEKKAARANPERIWVQVAGGAYAGDLPKAYAAVKAKAPTVFGSRGGWSTPLRATNRVLTGPFKTDAEARAFVNQLAKAGVSAFTFTSEPGQAVTKLGSGKSSAK